ncbi:MAG: helix-turn-helix transcriptional regulator [Actinobacteria bacterium]|nr:helix-turn-helix transcriptional regulator [Actinomycetota bacterium]
MSLLRLQIEGRRLTTPELEVLRAAADGLSARETGETLCKSEHTIATQRRAAQAKLGAKNLTHAIALAYKRGIL